MQISLITPLFNRLDLTRACLESARRTLRRWDYEWIFIDDGSTDGTRDFLRALPTEGGRIRVVCNDAPRGFAANNNHGAQLARAPLLCLLNNDTVLMPRWLEPMARLARLLPDVACVGNVQREPVSGLIDHAGMYFNRDGDVQHAGKDAQEPPREDFLEWPAVTAACCVIRRRVFLDLGGFDEAFLNGGEDVDFCLRAGTRGYRHFVANRSVIYHHVSASPGRKTREENNARLFRARWGEHLQAARRARRTPGDERRKGWRYLREAARRPWRVNGWRLAHAAGQILSTRPPSRQPNLLPRLRWWAEDFLRQRWIAMTAKAAAIADTDPPVFLVVGDGTLSPRRAGVPTVVRSLAGAFGRMNARVHPVGWKPATRSLGLLSPEVSLGLDAERLGRKLPAGWRAPSAASLVDPAMADWRAPGTDPPSLHEFPAPDAVPPGAWIVLPEVLYGGLTEQIVAYAHRHGWRLAVILYDAMPTIEPTWFPFGTATEHERYFRAVSGADLVLPVSDHTAEAWRLFVQAKGLPHPPVKVCVPGADTCTRTRGEARVGRREPGEAVRMLCVSGVEPRKNHRALIAAFDLAVAARPDLDLALTLVGVPRLFSEDNVPEAVRAFVERHPGA